MRRFDLSKLRSRSGMGSMMGVMIMTVVAAILSIILARNTTVSSVDTDTGDISSLQWNIRRKYSAMLRSPGIWARILDYNGTDSGPVNDGNDLSYVTGAVASLKSCFLTLSEHGRIEGLNSIHDAYPVTSNSATGLSAVTAGADNCVTSTPLTSNIDKPAVNLPRMYIVDSQGQKMVSKNDVSWIDDNGEPCDSAAGDYTCRWNLEAQYFKVDLGGAEKLKWRLVVRLLLTYIKNDEETFELIPNMYWDTTIIPGNFELPSSGIAPNMVTEYTIRARTDTCLSVVPNGTVLVPAGTNVSWAAMPIGSIFGGPDPHFTRWEWGNNLLSNSSITPTITTHEDRNMIALCEQDLSFHPNFCKIYQSQVGDPIAPVTDFGSYHTQLTNQTLSAWDNFPRAEYGAGMSAAEHTTIRNCIQAQFAAHNTAPAGGTWTVGGNCAAGVFQIRVDFHWRTRFITLPGTYNGNTEATCKTTGCGVSLAVAIWSTSATPFNCRKTSPANLASCTNYSFQMNRCDDRFAEAVCETEVELSNGRRLVFRTTGADANESICLEEGLTIQSTRLLRGDKPVVMTNTGACACDLKMCDPPEHQFPPAACENGDWVFAPTTSSPMAFANACNLSIDTKNAANQEFRTCDGRGGTSYITCEKCVAKGAPALFTHGTYRVVERFCPWGSASLYGSAGEDTCTNISEVGRCKAIPGGVLRCQCSLAAGTCRWVSESGGSCP